MLGSFNLFPPSNSRLSRWMNNSGINYIHANFHISSYHIWCRGPRETYAWNVPPVTMNPSGDEESALCDLDIVAVEEENSGIPNSLLRPEYWIRTIYVRIEILWSMEVHVEGVETKWPSSSGCRWCSWSEQWYHYWQWLRHSWSNRSSSPVDNAELYNGRVIDDDSGVAGGTKSSSTDVLLVDDSDGDDLNNGTMTDDVASVWLKGRNHCLPLM